MYFCRKQGIMMKIVYLFSELTIRGGTDKILTGKANYLAENGYDVTIITEAQMGRDPIFPLSPKVKLIDIGLDFNKQYTQSLLHRIYTYFSYIHIYKKRLRAILDGIKPDIVITTMGRSLDFITKINDGSIKIGEAHTTKEHLRSLHLMEQRGGIYKLIARFIRKRQIANARKLSALVLLTPEDANSWKDVTKTYVIPNFIERIPEEIAILNNKRAITVGRYNDAKGYEFLVEAWKYVNQRHPDWIIDIYGSGELHDDVEKWIKDSQLQETMIMHEPTEDIMQKYIDSSICVVSSRYEGFSMVIIEAMACGVPCVSFDCPFGPKNIIKDGEDGILVDYLNSQSLGENICKLIEDKEYRVQIGNKAKENSKRFSRDAIMKQWTDIFKSISNKYE